MNMLVTAAGVMRVAACSTLGVQRLAPLAAVVSTLIACGAGSSAAWSATAPQAAHADASDDSAFASFDLGMLKSRGIDPKVADFFGRAPRFSEGTRRVTLTVNGRSQGNVEVHFDAEGHVCFNQMLLNQAQLKTPDSRYKSNDRSATPDEGCYDFVTAYPQTEIVLLPNREEVSLLVSSDALRPFTEDVNVYQTGGIAGMFNYEILGLNTQFSGSSSRYYSTNMELGFNAGDWILRSRQSYSAQNESERFQSLYTYAQKTFAPIASTLQVGQINIRNSVFPGEAITGLQLVPEAGLQPKSLGGATVQGIAQSQARVEVRQSGALVHTSLVPSGPFTLPNIQLLNSFTDLDVLVVESNGEEHRFTVPAASLVQTSLSAPGFSMAVGEVRTFGESTMPSPTLVTASSGWLLGQSSTVSAGLLMSDNAYRAAAWTLGTKLGTAASVSARNTLTYAGEEDVMGAQGSLSISSNLSQNINVSANYTRQSDGFRSLHDTVQAPNQDRTNAMTRDQYGIGLGWNDARLGSLTAGYSRSNRFDGQTSNYVNANWSKSFKHATVSLNLSRDLGGRTGSGNGAEQPEKARERNTAMYLTVSVPLGGNRSVSSFASKRDDNTRFGTTFQDYSSDFASYRLSTERDAQQQSFSGDVNMLPRFAQASLGYSRTGADSRTYSGQLRGGVALHGGGVTLSPYPLTDTFGVAKVGDVSGVKLNTPGGPVWTDPWGNAVLPQVNAYGSTPIEIDTKSLPRNVDIQNGFKALSAGRGSVSTLDFPVIKSRRALLHVTDEAGNTIGKGASVFNAQGDFVTTVVEDGKVFISNVELNDALTISLGEEQSCNVSFMLPDEQDLNVYFETANATCRTS